MVDSNAFFIMSYVTFCSSSIFIIAALFNLRYTVYTLLGRKWTEYEFDDPVFKTLMAVGVLSWLLTCTFMAIASCIQVCVQKEKRWRAVEIRPSIEMIRLNAEV